MTTDPKDPAHLFSNRTLWLDPSTMEQARDNFWQAFQAAGGSDALTRGQGGDRRTWDIAFAAAIAAISYVMEGNLGPR